MQKNSKEDLYTQKDGFLATQDIQILNIYDLE